jgi:hypothetical protein
VDTGAGAQGFDKDYFVQQVAGLSQITGDFMVVKPLVVDLGWGTLKAALVNLPNSGFVSPHEAAVHRGTLGDQYVSTFRHIETNALDEAKSTLKDLAANISARVATDKQAAITTLVEGQLAKLG